MRWRILLPVFGAAAVGLLWLAFDLLSPYRGYAGNMFVVIEPGWRVSQVADLLVARGVLRHRLPFLVRYWAGRPRHALRAGEYLFDRPLRPIDVYRRLVQGDVYLHSVVIPEGRTALTWRGFSTCGWASIPCSSSESLSRLWRYVISIPGRLRSKAIFSRTRTDSPAASVPQPLFSQCWRVSATSLPRDLRSKGLRRPDGWHEVMTLASLIEKETPEASERPLIAGVFERRLERGMPLQSDPTVVYAARLDHRPVGPITQGDLEFDSPYNTYRHSGLPPGPIANPGQASIRAALHTADGDALYFVANNHGGHVFARTLAEHQRNVSRYRREVAALRRNEPGTASRNSKLPAHEASKSAAQAQKRARNTQQEANHP